MMPTAVLKIMVMVVRGAAIFFVLRSGVASMQTRLSSRGEPNAILRRQSANFFPFQHHFQLEQACFVTLVPQKLKFKTNNMESNNKNARIFPSL
jgi:hypothetical protein